MPDRADLLYADTDLDSWYDLGHEVNIRIADDHGFLALVVAHPSGGNLGKVDIDGWCYGSITTNPAAPEDHRWDLISRYPLHVEPSLLCNCGHHGHIRNWKWEPA